MELKLEDLFETCPTCNGSGKDPEEPKSHGARSDETSSDSFTGDLTDCNACGGYGRGKLTRTGEVLLDFLRIIQRRNMIS
jgi:hypothetical protein